MHSDNNLKNQFNLAPIFRSKWMTHSRHVAGRWRRRWGTRRAATTWADNPWLAAVVWSNERGLQVIFRWSALDRRRLSNGVRWLCNQFIHSSSGEQHTFTWPTFPPSTCTAPPLKPNTNCPMRSAWTEGRQFDGKYENLTVKSKSPISSLRVRYLKICSYLTNWKVDLKFCTHILDISVYNYTKFHLDVLNSWWVINLWRILQFISLLRVRYLNNCS